jgi:cytosine/adenosine deaminase-related metal-dependent hydrolase
MKILHGDRKFNSAFERQCHRVHTGRRGGGDRRVNLGIGTDGANCADNQNMYEAMRLASFVSKVQGPDWRRWLTTRRQC